MGTKKIRKKTGKEHQLFKSMDKSYNSVPHRKSWKAHYRGLPMGNREKDRQNNLILSLEPSADGTIKFVIDENKLLNNIYDGFVELNLLEEIAGSGRFSKPEGNAAEPLINALNSLKKNIDKLSQNSADFNKYLKETGFSSLEMPPVKNYFKELVHKLRDKRTPPDERRVCTSKRNSFITALTYTDKQPVLHEDFSGKEFDRVRFSYMKKFNRMNDFKQAFCVDYCQRKRTCKVCTHEKELKEHLRKQYTVKEIADFLKCKNRSKYAEELTTRKFHLDRSRYYDVLHTIESQDM